MWDMLYALGIGLAFSVGVGTGAFLCRIATKEGRDDTREEWIQHQKIVEDRLASYVLNTEIMAQQLKKIADKE